MTLAPQSRSLGSRLAGEVAGERRIVSILITDVVGSTAIAEQLGPERSKALFDEVARIFEDAVHRFGGTVAQHTGDGVLALFGAPVAHEDDAERAVRAARAVHEALGGFGRELGEAYGIELAARATVSTGPVVVPRADAPAEVIYNALGDTVNVAARLQAHVDAGGVVVSESAARRLDDAFELERIGELELKGKEERVLAYGVIAEREVDRGSRTTLVGRMDELAVIERVFGGVLEGRGAIVCITGEAGIGKSRLVAEARGRYGEDVEFLAGHAVAYAEEIPYWPVRELLRDWLELGPADPAARARLELRTALNRVLGAEADESYAFLATVLGVSPGPEGEHLLRDLSRDSVQRQTFDAVHELVVALARERPLCLVLEDLHWADEATLRLVEELLETGEEEAVVLLLVYRSERESGAWRLAEHARERFPHRHHELELHALDDEECRQLGVDAAGAELPESVSSLLCERSGGNPYFLEQALRDLIERGALAREDGGYVLRDGAKPTVPALVQEALQARLDRLAPEARDLVGAAAVVGRTFGAPALERLAPGVRLAPLLSDLQRLDLIVEERRRPFPEYRFRHGLLREVAYGSLLEARRRELHRAAGLALEGLHSEAIDEVHGLLAYHFTEADEPEKAAHYLVAAGDGARALYANREALAYYRRAVPYLDRIGDERLARDALLRIGLTHHLSFEYEAANDAYRQAFARRVAPEPGQEPTSRLEVATSRVEGIVPGHASSESGTWWANQLYRGLLALDADLIVRPDVAESFEISADGRKYVFRLREDARWSDGVRVTADDFVFAWNRIREEGLATAFSLADLAGSRAVDERTLEVELVAPRSYALHLFASVEFFPWPRHVVERLGPDWHRMTGLVGNGPYMIAERDDRHVLLRRSPTAGRFTGNVGEVTLLLEKTYEEVARMWQAGALDMSYPLRFQGITAESPDTVESVSRASPRVEFLGFHAGCPALADVRVRRALADALDVEQLAVEAYETPAYGGMIPPCMPGHSHRFVRESDRQSPQKLLAEAGFPDGKGLPPLTLVALGGGLDERRAGKMAAQWDALGVRVRLELTDWVRIDQAKRELADMWIIGWNAEYPDPHSMLGGLLDAAPEIVRDDRVSALLERANALTDPDERWKLYREADRLLVVETVAVFPLAYMAQWFIHRPWVEGLDARPLGSTSLDRVVVRPELRPAHRPPIEGARP